MTLTITVLLSICVALLTICVTVLVILIFALRGLYERMVQAQVLPDFEESPWREPPKTYG
jgi:hypothetical protein